MSARDLTHRSTAPARYPIAQRLTPQASQHGVQRDADQGVQEGEGHDGGASQTWRRPRQDLLAS